MSAKVEAISDRVLELGEGPHWDSRSQALYLVSIMESTLHKFVPTTGIHTKTTLENPSSFIVPIEGSLNQFVITQKREVVVIQWDGAEDGQVKTLRRLGEVDEDKPENLFNDGKADPRGRLYAGTMSSVQLEGSDISRMMANIPKERGSIFRLDQRGFTKVWEKISVANGLAWDEAAGAMYYIDTAERKILKSDYDVENGDISNMRYIFDFEKLDVAGYPDGMTIDTDGNLWVAAFNGAAVLLVSPEGILLRKVPIPVTAVTSCTFGGPNLDIIYVTTGSHNFGTEPEPLAGRTFKITGLGVKGHPNMSFKL